MNVCKKCLTMNVDNWDPDTYLPILEEADVPYIPRVWNNLLKNYCQDPEKVNGMTVIGRYLGTMRMTQYKKWRWADTDYLQKVDKNEKEVALRNQGKSESEIQQIITESNAPIEKPQELIEKEKAAAAANSRATSSLPLANKPSADELGLTEDDVNYLSIKWGSSYAPDEWVKLEQLWVEMNESYDIQTAGERDSLKMICKTSLKAHQLIDLGDEILRSLKISLTAGKSAARRQSATNFLSSCKRKGKGSTTILCKRQVLLKREMLRLSQ